MQVYPVPKSHREARAHATAARIALHVTAAADLPFVDMCLNPYADTHTDTINRALAETAAQALTAYTLAAGAHPSRSVTDPTKYASTIIPVALTGLRLLCEVTRHDYPRVLTNAYRAHTAFTSPVPEPVYTVVPAHITDPLQNIFAPLLTIARDAALFVAALRALATEADADWSAIVDGADRWYGEQVARELDEYGAGTACGGCHGRTESPHRWYQGCHNTCGRRNVF